MDVRSNELRQPIVCIFLREKEKEKITISKIGDIFCDLLYNVRDK